MYNGILWVTTLSGKLDGFHGIGTSSLINPFCIKCHNCNNAICHECYGIATENRYSSMETYLQENTLKLDSIRADRELPFINELYFRFLPFGELKNDNHLINFIRTAELNQDTHFSIWTKRLDILKSVFVTKGHSKPSNLRIVLSSFELNKHTEIPDNLRAFIDNRFTVFTADFAIENDIYINCGNKQCKHCMNCYGKRNECFDIHEMLKKDIKRYTKSGGIIQ